MLSYFSVNCSSGQVAFCVKFPTLASARVQYAEAYRAPWKLQFKIIIISFALIRSRVRVYTCKKQANLIIYESPYLA